MGVQEAGWGVGAGRTDWEAEHAELQPEGGQVAAVEEAEDGGGELAEAGAALRHEQQDEEAERHDCGGGERGRGQGAWVKRKTGG